MVLDKPNHLVTMFYKFYNSGNGTAKNISSFDFRSSDICRGFDPGDKANLTNVGVECGLLL